MARPWCLAHATGGLMMVTILVACQTAADHRAEDPVVRTTVPPTLRVPSFVQRLAVVYPKTYSRSVGDAYLRLESAAFQLKVQRPSLQIVDRLELGVILGEQRLHVGGTVQDESAVRVGRLLGADSVLIYRIDAPTWRDQVMARYFDSRPPLSVTSKIIRVESAEVVFHNVVTTLVGRSGRPLQLSSLESNVDDEIRSAVDRGVTQTITDLHRAFRYSLTEGSERGH